MRQEIMGVIEIFFLDTWFPGHCYIDVVMKSCNDIVLQQDDITIGMLQFYNWPVFTVVFHYDISCFYDKNHHLRMLKYVWRLKVK